MKTTWKIWTTTDTRHVLRSELAGTQTAVTLAGARNEWVSFQILVRSGSPVAGVTVVPSDLVGPGRLGAGQAKLFRQHQLEVPVGTYGNAEFKPDWYPDPLIPFGVQPLQATIVAAPFDLPANQTHGFWIDVYIPPGTKAGLYRGSYRLSCRSSAIQIPVSLTVWNFDLPAVSTLVTALGSPRNDVRKYYEDHVGAAQQPTDWSKVDAQTAGLLSDHRVNATPPEDLITPVLQPEGFYRIPPDKLALLSEFIDRYHINAIEIPSLSVVVQDPVAEYNKLYKWLCAYTVASVALAKPNLTFYVYLYDEPNNAEAYGYVRKWGKAICDAHSAVRVMVTEQDAPQDPAWGDLYGAVNIWCPLFGLFDPNTAAARQAAGDMFWSYTALNQYNTPQWHIDFPLLNYRVPAWIAWRHRIRGLLYWGAMSWWRDVNDPWTNPGTYSFTYLDKLYMYNGEGTLIYPGLPTGYHGIASSIRLKALRDGIQDYEYMAILEHMGKADAAQAVVQPLAQSWLQWNHTPGVYQTARAKLAQLITT